MQVKIIRTDKQAALVEFNLDGQLQRAVVPLNVLTMEHDSTAQCDENELLMGIPFGVEWANYLSPRQVTPERIQNVLRNNGIWTAADAENNPKAVLGAIQQVYAFLLGEVLKAAKSVRKEK